MEHCTRLLVLTLLAGCPALVAAGELAVHTDFEGGSGKVIKIDQQQRLVSIDPTPHEDRGWICWWYIKLTGIEPGETIALDVGEGVWATPDQATFSTDGKTWKHTEPGKRDGKRIAFRQKIEGDMAWFAWGPPFVPANAKQLVEEAAAKLPHANAFTLCHTRADRPVPALRINDPGVPETEKLGIWVQARQHAWESGSSWVCRGFVDWITSDDERAVALRKKSLITIVPIMDIDSVADGAGGKQQKPQDHNRDWSDAPHWKSVAAAQQAILKLNEDGRFDLFVDLHNPGAGDKQPYYYVPPRDLLSELGRQNLVDFVEATKTEMTGPLKIDKNVRESGSNYDRNWQKISKNWVMFHTRDHVVSVTLETAWNTPNSTTDGYRQVGRELGLSIERYFRTARRRAVK